MKLPEGVSEVLEGHMLRVDLRHFDTSHLSDDDKADITKEIVQKIICPKVLYLNDTPNVRGLLGKGMDQ